MRTAANGHGSSGYNGPAAQSGNSNMNGAGPLHGWFCSCSWCLQGHR